MKIVRIYTILFFSIVPTIGFAQNLEEEEPQVLLNAISPQNFTSTSSINPVQMANSNSTSNSVYINQIGYNNSTSINTITKNSYIDLIQNGTNNRAILNFSALSATEIIQQNGDSNYLAAYGSTPSLNLKRTINQEGYGQNLIIHGGNSLSAKMKMNMKGSSSTIIIRNFN